MVHLFSTRRERLPGSPHKLKLDRDGHVSVTKILMAPQAAHTKVPQGLVFIKLYLE